MDINDYLGGHKIRLTNQRHCWSMTSLRRPMRATDKENVMIELVFLSTEKW